MDASLIIVQRQCMEPVQDSAIVYPSLIYTAYTYNYLLFSKSPNIILTQVQPRTSPSPSQSRDVTVTLGTHVPAT